MKEFTRKVFICDFCKKKLFLQHAMVNHEKYCTKNPINVSACTGCIHLIEVPKEYITEGYFDGYIVEEKRTTHGFMCNKLNLKLYHFIVEKRGIVKNHPEMFIDEQRMPTSCEHWDYI